jgi:hypothetical protein
MFKNIPSLFAAALTLGMTAAHAGDLPPEAAGEFMDACRYDYHRICSYVVPGDGRASRCLLDHETDLAPRCLKAVKMAFAIEACLPDYDRYCRGVPRGPEALACLSSRLDILHPTCRRIVADNQRYMRYPDGDRYAYHTGPYGAPGVVPYGTPPYGGNGHPPYGGAYQQPEPYASQESEAPRYQPYGGYPYAAPGQGYGRYAEGPAPQGGGERYAEEEEPRFQPYGQRPLGGGYDGRGYGGPSEPYGGSEESR